MEKSLVYLGYRCLKCTPIPRILSLNLDLTGHGASQIIYAFFSSPQVSEDYKFLKIDS